MRGQILLKTLRGLLSQMRRVAPAHRSSTWSDYAETATHYSEDDHARKRRFVAEALAAARPAVCLDVGCNTGRVLQAGGRRGRRSGFD